MQEVGAVTADGHLRVGASWVSDVSGYEVSQHQQVAVAGCSSVCPRLKHHRLLRVPAFGIYFRASMAVR